jgi:putative transposase
VRANSRAAGRRRPGYFRYYQQTRSHLSLDKNAPDLRLIELPATGKIVQRPEVGGLHHRYLRQAA